MVEAITYKMSGLGKALATTGVAISLASLCHAGEPTPSPMAPKSEPFTPTSLPYYFEVFGGYTQSPDLNWDDFDYPMDPGYNIGGALGMALTDSIDVEFEVMYTEADYEGYSSYLSSLSLMVNAFYNVPLGYDFEGYVGVGVGAMNLEYGYSGYSVDDWVFGYQVIVGARYPLTETIDVFAEYRYADAPDDADVGYNIEYNSHNVSVGLRFNF